LAITVPQLAAAIPSYSFAASHSRDFEWWERCKGGFGDTAHVWRLRAGTRAAARSELETFYREGYRWGGE